MTYHMTVVVHDGHPEVEHSGEIPDGRYEVTGTPDQHGPAPSVRYTRHENYTGPSADRPAQEDRF